MSLHLHSLAGCCPTPLAHYLKALGILRVVSEQVDADARGFWRDEQFWLLTKLDSEGLLRFFLHEMSPSPLVAPWNKGSGFFGGSSGVPAIEASTAERFLSYRRAIEESKSLLAPLSAVDEEIRALKEQINVRKGMSVAERLEAKRLKASSEHRARLADADKRFKELKSALLPQCRRSWRDGHLEWMNAAVVLNPDEDPDFPSILGTGGNDGRLDFTNNFMQRWAELLDLDDPQATPMPHARALLERALFSTSGCADSGDSPVGQFFPGAAGGANASTGAEGESVANPWDFVLMLEGTLVVQARATRRLDDKAGAKSSAPFSFYAQASGYGSAGDEKASRGEQWLPLWTEASSLGELRQLFGEARMRVGGASARRPVDALRALTRLGTVRGIDGFVRFGYLERLGQSNLAVPLGRLAVRPHPHARLADDLAEWLSRLDRARNAEHAPASLRHAVKSVTDALFAALSHDPAPLRWQAVLVGAARVEVLQAQGSGFEAGPIPTLRADWLTAANDGSPEWRLALSLAQACTHPERPTPARDGVRRHAVPLDKNGRFATSDDGGRLVRRPEVVLKGRRLLDELNALLSRRALEVETGRGFGLRAPWGCQAWEADLAQFISGQVDDMRILDLSRALMAIELSSSALTAIDLEELSPSPSESDVDPEPAWWALRLACACEPWAEGQKPSFDPAILRRAYSGDGAGAVRLALLRIGGRGLRPGFVGAVADADLSRRWGAALAFPISRKTTRSVARRLDPHAFLIETQGDQE